VSSLTGAQVVPAGQGAPAGDGNARVTLRPAKQKICFRIAYKSIGPTKGLNAGIYKCKKGQNGDLVKTLFTGDKASPVEGCAKNVSSAKVKAIRSDPKSFHVNVKTDKYKTSGAIRGQLKPRSQASVARTELAAGRAMRPAASFFESYDLRTQGLPASLE
jgi:hypothetical protein